MTVVDVLPRFAEQHPEPLVVLDGAADGAVEVPPLGPRLQLVRAALVALLLMTSMLLVQLVFVSARQHDAAQRREFADFRQQLAEGTAPTGPTDESGAELAVGTPVAYLEVPSIGLQEVVVEGTTPGALFSGPGHRRDTPLPGQVGVSVVYGRRAAYGGPFADIGGLDKGAKVTVTTGQGVFTYVVLGVRHAGDPAPPSLAPGAARLTLSTAGGAPFLPSGVVRVDADLDATDAVVGEARVRSARTLSPAEQTMAGDGRSLWVLAMWLQGLLLVTLGAVWAWHRWGHAHAWVVFFPALLLVALFTSSEVARLLPNLM